MITCVGSSCRMEGDVAEDDKIVMTSIVNRQLVQMLIKGISDRHYV